MNWHIFDLKMRLAPPPLDSFSIFGDDHKDSTNDLDRRDNEFADI